MPYLNKTILIGHLGADPDVRTTANGGTMARFSVATAEHWTDKQTRERRSATTWHNIIAWDKKAELAGKMLHKGDLAYIEGKLKRNKYTDSSGIERTSWQVQVDLLLCLKQHGGNPQKGAAQVDEQEKDDVPF